MLRNYQPANVITLANAVVGTASILGMMLLKVEFSIDTSLRLGNISSEMSRRYTSAILSLFLVVASSVAAYNEIAAEDLLAGFSGKNGATSVVNSQGSSTSDFPEGALSRLLRTRFPVKSFLGFKVKRSHSVSAISQKIHSDFLTRPPQQSLYQHQEVFRI